MTVEHHNLVHEFPHLKEQIHQLKTTDNYFRKLFDQYHELTTEIEKMENEAVTVSTETEETAKIRRVHLKDQLHSLLTAEPA
jgi:uncharacterized protein YdcH (DUF465 family)